MVYLYSILHSHQKIKDFCSFSSIYFNLIKVLDFFCKDVYNIINPNRKDGHIMKSLSARIAAILLVAAIGGTLSACSKDDSDISSVSDSNAEVSLNGESSVVDGENSSAIENDNSNSEKSNDNSDSESSGTEAVKANGGAAEDPTAFLKQEITFGMDPSNIGGGAVQDPTESPVPVQTEIHTKKVVVTEKNGNPAKDSSGQTVTEVVTEIKNKYVSVPVSKPVYWLDMTGNSDKVFNGDIMKLEFKIKENTPDGNYPIVLSSPDFVNWAEEQLDIKTVGGYVTVGNATPTQPAQVQPGQFTIASSCASGKVGDTITISLDISDNPGIVGMLFKVEFDSGALEFVSAESGSAMEDVSPLSAQ